jgi:hypothetical protein
MVGDEMTAECANPLALALLLRKLPDRYLGKIALDGFFDEFLTALVDGQRRRTGDRKRGYHHHVNDHSFHRRISFLHNPPLRLEHKPTKSS